MQIKNNSVSFNIWTSNVQNASNEKKYMKEIASGLIAPTDDPAGTGIAARLLADIHAENSALRNVDSSISVVQTSQSWTSQIGDSLQRMKELAIESKSGTLSSADQANLATEFKSLQNEITRISSKETAAATFNGTKLLQGGDIKVQADVGIDQTINLEMADLSDQNNAIIGEVVTYDNTGDAQITEVHWNEVIDSANGLQISDEKAIGVIDEAIEYVAGSQVQNATELVRLEDTREALMNNEANLREAQSKIADADIASSITSLSKESILKKASQAMLVQGNNLSSLVILDLLRS